MPWRKTSQKIPNLNEDTIYIFRDYADPLDKIIKFGKINTYKHTYTTSDSFGRQEEEVEHWLMALAYFECRYTGEIYQVAFYDLGSSEKHYLNATDSQWILECENHIIRKFHSGVKKCLREVCISRMEWYILRNCSDILEQLDPKGEKQFSEKFFEMEEGFIGHYRRIPIVIDPTISDNLPPR